MKRSCLFWLFFFPVLGMLTSCGNEKNAGPPGAEAAAVKTYKVLTIAPRSIVLNSDFPARIEGQQNVEIRPKIDGYIERIFVDEGANVRRGQRLFQISAPQYEQEVRTARANIQIATANVNAAQMEVNKVQPLVEKKIISQYELQAAQFNLQAKQAALAQARATLANAQTNLGYTVVTSPVEGVIGALPHKIGSLVSSNTPEPLTTVSNTGNIYAYFSINEKQALAFSASVKGATTQERLKSLPPVILVLATGAEYPHKGRVETATGQIDPETGSVRVRATFPNPGGTIRSGSSGIVRIPTPLDSAITIPQKATYEIQGKRFVYKLDTAATVKSVEISTREGSGGQFFVVEGGLKPGDKIVVEGVGALREGLKIKPVEVKADEVFREEPQ